MDLSAQLSAAQTASREIAGLSTEQKNRTLQAMADHLRQNVSEILEENLKDITEGEKNDLGPLLDRLLLTPERIEAMAQDIENVIKLHDFIGEVLSEKIHANGMSIRKIRVPMGVIGMIYESRPNVTVDAAVLAFKSGNAVVLKGGKEAAHSNRILVKILRAALETCGISSEAIQLLDGATREDTFELMKARGKVDLLIPRGSNFLISFVRENSSVPVIETGASPVHTFVDASADLENAADICFNEKTRRVSVCNALDTILVHEQIYSSFLEKLNEKLKGFNPQIRIHADQRSFALLEQLDYPTLEMAKEEDFDREWLDYEMSIRIVSDLNEALEHIRKHSLGHSESIITNDPENAEIFLNEVDAACVYHNASTAFSDGGEFGLGAEIGVSTQKLHARGPFALEALTTTKWIVRGDGQIRG